MLRDKVRVEAIGMCIGESTYAVECPLCNISGSFSITRTNEGLLYNCFRASCPCRGFIPSMGASKYNERKMEPKKHHPFRGRLELLPDKVYTFLQEKYEIARSEALLNGWRWDADNERLYMPTMNVLGLDTGAVCKKLPWSEYGGPKAVNYPNGNDDVGLHFPPEAARGYTIVVVEDIISAVKVSQILPACALTGTSMNETQASLLASCFDNIVFMLDPDATTTAVKLSRKYGAMFSSSHVVVPDADPKDTPLAKLKEMLTCSDTK